VEVLVTTSRADDRADYDVIVVGARCGGAPTAMLLARLGHRVLMVDRVTFPKDTISSHFVHAYGVARLARWGVLPALLRTGCPPVNLMTSDWGEITLTGTPPPYEGIDFGLCPRRYIIDELLNSAAVEAGAEFEEGFNVVGLLGDGDRVTGVRGRRRTGAEVEVTARYVVGADGMHSFVARAVGAAEYDTVPRLTTTFYSYFENLPMDRLLIHWRPGRCVPAIPTHDGLTVVLCGWSYDGWQEYRRDIEGNYFRTIESQASPEFVERVRSAKRVAKIVGHHHSENFFRKPYGAGWALVGDAGYHKDPVTALGMSDAFRDSEFLAQALDETLSGRRPAAEALGDYERRRNEAGKPLYDYTIEQARYEPLAGTRKAVLKALANNEEDRNRFFGVLAGSVSVEEFSSFTNMKRILTKAADFADAG
jgi:2-polyprenyl-6-methoxyphenol hydroxylase-like FAD-dependent oxidoreductase